MNLVTKNKDAYHSYDSTVDVHKYSCEECGFIMSFTTEKKRLEKENAYDWSDFEND